MENGDCLSKMEGQPVAVYEILRTHEKRDIGHRGNVEKGFKSSTK